MTQQECRSKVFHEIFVDVVLEILQREDETPTGEAALRISDNQSYTDFSHSFSPVLILGI